MMGSLLRQYHPSVLFLYFCAAIGLTMSTRHPALILLSFVAGSLVSIYLNGLRAYGKLLLVNLLVFLTVTVMNPLFSSGGLTVLFYLWRGKPVTLESLLYGLTAGGLCAAVFVWCSCLNALLTGDKLIALFGRRLPNTAMMLSMALRYIPLTVRRAKQIDATQRALLGGARPTLSQTLRQYTVLFSWSFESSIETADSMKARGYGTRRRTHFTQERLMKKDGFALALLGVLSVGGVYAAVRGSGFVFYPWIASPEIGLPAYACFFLLLMLPILLEGKEMCRWLFYRLKTTAFATRSARRPR